MARIPGKMRRRQWVREGDLIIVWPWDFQDSKADVKHRYTKTQAMYLSRKQVLPDVVDMFGMNSRSDEDDIGDDLFGSSGAVEEAVEETDHDDEDVDDMFGSDEDNDDVDDMFGSDEDDDDVDDMFGSDEDEVVEEQQIVENMPEPEPLDDDDDDDDDIDALFA